MQEVTISKVRFDKTTLKEATKIAINWAKTNAQKYMTTPNPEILLEANKNGVFLEVLNSSHLNIADGIGILWASKYLKIAEKSKSKLAKIGKWFLSLCSILFRPSYIKTELTERVTGVDLMENICKEAAREGLKVFLLGAAEKTAEKVKEILERKYPEIKIVGTFSGSPKEEHEKEILDMINAANPDILFVAYGAPSQEIWIHKNIGKTTLKVAIGVGGAFNFIAGIRKRAPKWMRRIGLEWLYRLLQEPSRAKRIYNATIKFPLTILKESFKKS